MRLKALQGGWERWVMLMVMKMVVKMMKMMMRKAEAEGSEAGGIR